MIHCFRIICMAMISFSCKQKENNSLVEVKKLDYPSASGIEYYKGQLYIIGDDANDLLVVDTGFNLKNSIHLYN